MHIGYPDRERTTLRSRESNEARYVGTASGRVEVYDIDSCGARVCTRPWSNILELERQGDVALERAVAADQPSSRRSSRRHCSRNATAMSSSSLEYALQNRG